MNWDHLLDLIHHEVANGSVANSVVRVAAEAAPGSLIGGERELGHCPTRTIFVSRVERE